MFTNFSVVAAILPIIGKLNIILRSECGSTWEFMHSLGKELKEMIIFPLKNIFYSAIFCNYAPDFEDFSILATKNNDVKVKFIENRLINRDHPPLNKSKQFLPLLIAKEQSFII